MQVLFWYFCVFFFFRNRNVL